MALKLTFLGVGGAFAPMSKGNSNMMLTSENGKRMLIDFGTTAPYIYRDEMGLDFRDIDAVYVTHCHADHIGGLELLAFSRYFIPQYDDLNIKTRPKLYANKALMKELWEHSLKGGLESVQGQIMNLTNYFECKPVSDNKSFVWEGYEFTPVQTVHVRSGYIIKHSYGLTIRRKIPIKTNDLRSIHMIYDAYITSDTQFDAGLIEYYSQSKVIFHDCETSELKSNVHANYADLKTLPESIRKKMWMYHYGQKVDTFKEDGFAGFVEKGQEFII